MGDWLLNLPIPWMALFIFAATYFIASCVYLAVVRLAVDDRRARAFKAFSPGMLPVLGTIFALLVAFVAVQVWNDFDKAKLAVATEASALRAVDVFAETLPGEQRTQLRAPILLLDEPTSSLDSEAEAKVQAALEELMRGRTVLMIAHRLSTVKKADLICVLDQGRIIEAGRHEELVAKGGLYTRLHRTQFGIAGAFTPAPQDSAGEEPVAAVGK
jgi:Protein of unknown function (DUF4239)